MSFRTRIGIYQLNEQTLKQVQGDRKRLSNAEAISIKTVAGEEVFKPLTKKNLTPGAKNGVVVI